MAKIVMAPNDSAMDCRVTVGAGVVNVSAPSVFGTRISGTRMANPAHYAVATTHDAPDFEAHFPGTT